MLPEKIIYVSIVTSFVGGFLFIKSILEGKAKPNLVTWFLWALAPLVGSFLQYKAGGGLSILPIFLVGFFPLVIFFVALFKGDSRWKITNFDIICGVFSALALILWIITKRTDVSILFAILSDALAAIPTIIKAWKFPETEKASGYTPGIINNILGLLIIKDWRFSIYSFGIYIIVLNILLVILISRKKIFPTRYATHNVAGGEII